MSLCIHRLHTIKQFKITTQHKLMQIKRKLQNQAHKENVLKNTMKQAAETTASYIQKKQTNWPKTWAKIKERRIKTKLSLTTTQTPSTHNRIQNIWQGSQNKHEKKKNLHQQPTKWSRTSSPIKQQQILLSYNETTTGILATTLPHWISPSKPALAKLSRQGKNKNKDGHNTSKNY